MPRKYQSRNIVEPVSVQTLAALAMKWFTDPTRRFARRPHYDIDEIETACEELVRNYFQSKGIDPVYPLSTSILSKILEQHTERCDFGGNLTEFGDDVEGLTQFSPDRKPVVFISAHLRDYHFDNRRRMTIAHELGHVRLHSVLFQSEQTLDLFAELVTGGPTYCRRSTIIRGGDWMEWQASYAAGALLMPARLLRLKVEYELNLITASAPLTHDDPRARYLTSKVCENFDVSGEAASVRLLQRGYIQPRQMQSLTF